MISGTKFFVQNGASFPELLGSGQGKLFQVASISYQDYLAGLAAQGKR
ncbi:MAG TPA: hypothetical protein VMG34_07695 [Bacteroidota bacterium]|nr:hypothetical protein [Bacteroidota bacterium]